MESNLESKLLISGSQDGVVVISSLATGKVIKTLNGHTDTVESVSFCAKLPLAASGSMDNKVIIWDINSGQQRSVLNLSGGVVKLKWHPSDPFLFVASSDAKITLFDGRDGKVLKSFSGHSDVILDLDLSDDGNTILTCSDDKSVLVFSNQENN